MPRIAYVNGRYVPHGHAAVHVEDRGYQLADGVYEVCEVRGGRLVDERRHMARLNRSLAELRIDWPMAPAALAVVMREVVRQNRVRYGIVYVQVTRGVAPRDHAFPTNGAASAVVVTARTVDIAAREKRAGEGVAIVTVPDNRWGRVDIKTIALLPNVLAKQTAREAGAYEAWFVDGDGFVTEGASTNAWIVTPDQTVVTRFTDKAILSGITRAGVLGLVAAEKLRFEERRFTVAEAVAAREAFITSAGTIVMPVVRIDGRNVGNGRPGKLAMRLRTMFHDHAEIGEAWASGPSTY